MRRLLITLISCVTLNLTLWGQLAGIPPKGALSTGLGGISSIDVMDWAVFNNPAGLANITDISVLAGYQSILNFPPFNSLTAAINLPTAIGTGGIGVSKFGDELLNTQMLHLGFARKIGIMSLGAKVVLLQLNIDGFGKRSVLLTEFGGLADLSPEITIGSHIYNLTQSNLVKEQQEKIPTIIRLSVDYHPNKQLNVYAEIEKDVLVEPDLKFGIAYRVIEHVTVRTGLSTLHSNHSFGASVENKRFRLDYGIRVNQGIGMLHSFGLIYQIRK